MDQLLRIPMSYVIKIGGSLEQHLDPLLINLQHCSCPALIVPGGGRFADMIRRTGIGGDAAHWMAIAAMEQFGWLIASKGIRYSTTLHHPSTLEVLLPYLLLRQVDPLPHTWEVTSDTIAGWVACSLGLDLILLKPVDGIYSDGILQERVRQNIDTSVVDPCFLPFVLKNKVKTKIINGTTLERLERFLDGNDVPGTTIGF